MFGPFLAQGWISDELGSPTQQTEVTVKIQSFHFWCLIPILIAFILLSACSPAWNAGIAIPAANQPDNIISDENKVYSQKSSPSGSNINQVDPERSVPEGMVAFEGSVFVASTKPDIVRWQSSGWHISNKPFKSDDDQPPQDCTLYPHKGVEDQWIGNCFGTILIPKDGALHIAVMHTALDGSTTLIQVAPPPDMSGP